MSLELNKWVHLPVRVIRTKVHGHLLPLAVMRVISCQGLAPLAVVKLLLLLDAVRVTSDKGWPHVLLLAVVMVMSSKRHDLLLWNAMRVLSGREVCARRYILWPKVAALRTGIVARVGRTGLTQCQGASLQGQDI